MQKMQMQSADLIKKNIEKLQVLFPTCVTESKGKDGQLKKSIDFDKLKQLLSSELAEGRETYDFTWVGKNASLAEAHKRTTKTLRPYVAESRDWKNTGNLYIEGDNLEVLKLLQESYLGKIKMIYIDPPYNTGNDFIYRDNFTMSIDEYNEQIELYDGEKRLFKNTDANGRFHSDWCSKIYPRLLLARNLLSEDGAIFISIDENEYTNLQNICNAVFGENNKAAEFVIIRSEGGGMAKQVVKGHDYLLVYAKDISRFIPLGKPKDIRGKIIEKNGEKFWIQEDWLRKKFGKYGNCHYEEILQYKDQKTLDKINAGLKSGQYILIPKSNGMHIVGQLRSLAKDASKFYSILKHLSAHGIEDLKKLQLESYFSYPKPISLIYEIVRGMTMFTIKDNDIIMDFFSGSATTAHAVMQLNAEDGGNRKFIMVQLPEPCPENSEAYKTGFKTICDIGKERIRRAGDKIKKENRTLTSDASNLDSGFRVFKLADSNMEDVYFTPSLYKQAALDGLVDKVKKDRTSLDLLFGCLLELGLPLSQPHATEQISGCEVHNYNNGDLLACFDNNISEKVVIDMAIREPRIAVFCEANFKKSPHRINVAEIFKNYSPATIVRII